MSVHINGTNRINEKNDKTHLKQYSSSLKS